MRNNFPAGSRDQTVAGMYRLGAVVHQSTESSVRETEFGDDACPAVVKIRRVETPEQDRLVARWGQAIELIHPNLLRVYAAGLSVVDETPVSFVVMERADESLAGVLAERALSETETREMLVPALAALRYLHKNGYAHSNLKPSNILAVGDLVKLSGDDVTPVGDGGTPAEDMRALGAVVMQALTQRPPTVEDPGSCILKEETQPFTDIVRHCLDPDSDKRWTVDQVQARLDGQIAEPASSTPAPESNPPRSTPKWIYGALAALVLIVGLVGLARIGPGPRAGASPPPADPVASSPPETRAPEITTPRPASKPVVTAKAKGGWSVITAAYGSREPAEKRSREMAREWPNFKWSVFQQQAGKTYYLVVIGQNLSEDDAGTLRDHAVTSGLPRDTYIKKLQ